MHFQESFYVQGWEALISRGSRKRDSVEKAEKDSRAFPSSLKMNFLVGIWSSGWRVGYWREGELVFATSIYRSAHCSWELGPSWVMECLPVWAPALPRKGSKCMSGQCTAPQPWPMRVPPSMTFVCSTPSVKYSNRATRQWKFQAGRNKGSPVPFRTPLELGKVIHTVVIAVLEAEGLLGPGVQAWVPEWDFISRQRKGKRIKQEGSHSCKHCNPHIREDCKCRAGLDHVASPVQTRKLTETLSQWDL